METTPDQLRERMIVTGRAYVRMVEAADVLLDHRPVWTERLLLRLVRALYSHRLRGLAACRRETHNGPTANETRRVFTTRLT